MEEEAFHSFMTLIESKNVLDEEIESVTKPGWMKMKRWGWTALHLACWYRRSGVIEKFISNGANLDARTSKALKTPLHIAAMSGHLECVNILVRNGCRIDVVDDDGKTPKDISEVLKSNVKSPIPEYLDEAVKTDIFHVVATDSVDDFKKFYINEMHMFYKNNETGISLYQTIKSNGAVQIMNYLKSRPVSETEFKQYRQLLKDKDPEVIELNKENPLFECFVNFHLLKFEKQICARFANIDTALNFKCPLQLALDYGSRLLVGEILKYLINENEKLKHIWNINIHNENRETIKKIIQKRKKYLKKKKKKKFRRIHIGVLDNCTDVIDYLLANELCSVNDGLEDIGPAIYHAVKKDKRECVDTLLRYEPNMDYIDKFRQTLLHLAIKNNLKDQYEKFINNITKLNQEDQTGFTALHWAVIKKDEDAITQIISRNPQWNIVTDINMDSDPQVANLISKNVITNRENASSLCIKVNNSLYNCMLQNINKNPIEIESKDGDGNSLIHLASQRYLVDICKQLMATGQSCCDLKDFQERTPVMALIDGAVEKMKGNVTQELLDIIGILIYSNGNQKQIDYKYLDGKSVIQRAIEVEDERLLLSLTTYHPSISTVTEANILFCIEKHFFRFLEKSVDVLPMEVYRKVMKPSLFYDLIDRRAPCQCLINMFMSADQSNRSVMLENMLILLYENGQMTVFNDLMTNEVDQPQRLRNGETLLTYMIRKKETAICESLLMKGNSRLLVNLKNQNGKHPIHICAQLKQYDLIQSITPYISNVDQADSSGETALAMLLDNLSGEEMESDKMAAFRAIRLLIKAGGDIYRINEHNGTNTISHCKDSKWTSAIERFTKSLNNDVDEAGRNTASQEQLNECKICYNNQINCLLQCGHGLCSDCNSRIHECPFCRERLTSPGEITDN